MTVVWLHINRQTERDSQTTVSGREQFVSDWRIAVKTRIDVSIGCLAAHHSTNIIMSLVYLPFTPVRLQQVRQDMNNNDNYMYNNNNTCKLMSASVA